jgi:phosphoribosylaminoimidazole-succinocarboxamide synthase
MQIILLNWDFFSAPNFGDMFESPIIEYSTKLESTDVYIPKDRAANIAGLTGRELHRLTELVRIVAYRLRDIFERTGLVLWDGKLEFAFGDVDEEGHRTFQLVDSVGPDELRLTFNGVQLSKECLRKPYRGSDWHNNIGLSKKLAKDRGQRDWKSICTKELASEPPNLSVSLLEQISGMYQALTNVISEDLYGRKVFDSAPSIDVIASQLEQS